MNNTHIRLSHIKEGAIKAICSETLTGKKFKGANICWLKTWNGGDFDVLFNEFGMPLTDPDMVKRVGEFYNKRFEPIMFCDQLAFAQINTNEKSTQHQRAEVEAIHGKM